MNLESFVMGGRWEEGSRHSQHPLLGSERERESLQGQELTHRAVTTTRPRRLLRCPGLSRQDARGWDANPFLKRLLKVSDTNTNRSQPIG